MMVILDELINDLAINGRGCDTEGTRASGIADEIAERFVVMSQYIKYARRERQKDFNTFYLRCQLYM